MAGMEQLEIHSKSYIVRWVKVEEKHTISWSVQPHKKSINFGIVKHPGTGSSASVASTPRQANFDDAVHSLHPDSSSQRRLSATTDSRNDSSTAQDQLKAKGFILVEWCGKCEADKVSMGTFAVPVGHGGMYGLVFDNTFSKQISKTATFVLLTYPSNAPPHSSNLQKLQGLDGSHAQNSRKPSPNLSAAASESVESLQSTAMGRGASRGSMISRNDSEGGFSSYHVGVLQKRRRKKGQGYARRFFSLDFATCTLSYYYSRNSSALRGAIPLSLAAIAADERRREINIDSGAEIWHLKANNAKDFEDWTKALEKASNNARGPIGGVELETIPTPNVGLQIRTSYLQVPSNKEEENEWAQIEGLVSRIVGTRDAVRRLSKDTATPNRRHSHLLGAPSGSPLVEESADYFAPQTNQTSQTNEKRPFWKRKSSTPTPSTPTSMQRGVAAQLAVPVPAAASAVGEANADGSTPRKSRTSHEEQNIHDHCTSLLKDLDAVLSDFQTLIASSKRRRASNAAPMSARSTHSFESASTAEFFDAEAGDPDHSQVMIINRKSGEEETINSETEEEKDDCGASTSSSGGSEEVEHVNGAAALFPIKPKNLDPLPIKAAPKRRKAIPPATVMPPSLIGFLRKNVGKDLSTISMPVSANEPLSLLQRVAEQLEYCNLLNTAADQKDPIKRLLHVAAFAVSQFSNSRAKERAIRKPFNPMLGETFELVRSDQEVPGGFRLLVEKVSHRPVRMACQADSAKWSLGQSPAPNQKFWGKSAELITDGRVRMVLRLPDGIEERYTWNVATVFLRNVVMGEKYVEPVGNMTITNESTGAKALVEFKQKGMFGGRSEDVGVEAYDGEGKHTGTSLQGNWTSSLKLVEGGRSGPEIWKVGDLVDNAASCYGLTTFAAQLNEITEIEMGKLAQTDSRLRPDQRAAEAGKLDEAEDVKAKLEEAQRKRRRSMEERGEQWKAKWFVKVEGGVEEEGEEVWGLKGGKDGYWEERERVARGEGGWKGESVFEV
ncbi:Bcosh3 [Botrytis cinerea B05.10]|uniref:Bcosh3 n=1 Tax=Botryotinia fuckeliana (strain B05.10) TaxID=332648 RepID=A0A384JFP1_BOTFB|nr:Bcosh3 [Botrytis cinerea B05.10]ATZ49408.1 Bcosh3 [Botrytis cinerea B05.10]